MPSPQGWVYGVSGKGIYHPVPAPKSKMERPMKYNDLRDFIDQLEKLGELKRISVEVDPHLEMTEI